MLAAISLGTTALRAKSEDPTIKINPSSCVIVVPAKKTAVIDYAVEELQFHLKLITGCDVPVVKRPQAGQFPIGVGLLPPEVKTSLEVEEGRWVVTPKGIFLYGRDAVNKKALRGGGTARDIAMASKTQAGTLYAVYEFLENALGVHWIEPGLAGITYTPQKVLVLPVSEGQWVPQLVQRHMRTAYKEDLRDRALKEGEVPKDMQFSAKEFETRQLDERVWQKRMRMGSSLDFTYGHAFRKWWDKYGATHPEYFALGKNGKRGPASEKLADRVKMCVSNPALVKQVVKDHYAAGGGLVINACENDSRNFCRCPDCQALDVLLPGEENLDVEDRMLTDRYVHFTNAVLREARAHYDPKARVVFYAYSRYNQPPRRERLDDGVITFLLPNLSETLPEMEAYVRGWKNANATDVYMRTNALCQDTGLPLGFEQHMFGHYQLVNHYLNMKGTDYDTCWGFWPISGMTNYIMARGFYRPERSFADWENEYCGTYGNARDDVKAYQQYWQQIWNDRVMPNLDRITDLTPGMKLLRNKMANLAGLMYREEDFDQTDALLQKALSRDLTASERARVQTLVLANEHSRLTYRATKANGVGSTASAEEKKQTTQALYDFRRQHRLDLNMHWELLFYLENAYADNAGFERLLGTEPARMRAERLREEESVREVRTGNEQPFWIAVNQSTK